jgi:hypothetical protein
VASKVRERMAVSKQEAQNFDVERFNLRKLNEQEVMEMYQIKISNRFAPLEDFNDSEDINRAWENIKENIKTSAKESLGMYKLKHHKPWFDEECVKFLDRRKQAKMQGAQETNQTNVDNVNNLRFEASRHFRNKNKEYLKAKVYDLETDSKIRSI